jgi:hypothetical protein
VGFSRHQIKLGHFQEWTLPVISTAHDAIFHASRDAEQAKGFPELAYEFYDYGRRRPQRPLGEEEYLDFLSDSNSLNKEKGELVDFAYDLASALRRSFHEALEEGEVKSRSEELAELLGLAQNYSHFVEPHLPPVATRSLEQRKLVFDLEELLHEIQVALAGR